MESSLDLGSFSSEEKVINTLSTKYKIKIGTKVPAPLQVTQACITGELSQLSRALQSTIGIHSENRSETH